MSAHDAIDAALREVDRRVRDAGDLGQWITWTDDLPELALGGKRLRARLLLTCAASLDVLDDRAVTLAAAVEMIHNASLFHDDVIDNAHLRRGRLTLHTDNGNRFAIMTGDLCFARAMELVTALDNLAVYRRVGRAVVDLAAGQLAESLPPPPDGGLDHYRYVADRKTGSLLSLAVGLPGTLANLGADDEENLYRAGRLLGRVFQMADDLLDVTSTAAETGKDVFRDLRESRLTYPYLLLLRFLDDQPRARLLAAATGGPMPSHEDIRAWIRETNLEARATDELAQLLDDIHALVLAVPTWSDGDAFFDLCRAMAYRRR